MTIQPHIKTLNLNKDQQVQSMTVAFVNSPVMVHMRMNHRGITSFKTRPHGKMDSLGFDKRPYEKAALRLAFDLTGQTVWIRQKAKTEALEKVSLEFIMHR